MPCKRPIPPVAQHAYDAAMKDVARAQALRDTTMKDAALAQDHYDANMQDAALAQALQDANMKALAASESEAKLWHSEPCVVESEAEKLLKKNRLRSPHALLDRIIEMEITWAMIEGAGGPEDPDLAKKWYDEALEWAVAVSMANPSLQWPPRREKEKDPRTHLRNLLRDLYKWCLRCMTEERQSESDKGDKHPVEIPMNIAELQTKIGQAKGDDRWNMICLVKETGYDAAPDQHEIMRTYRPCCWTVCGIDESELKNAEGRLAPDRHIAFQKQYEDFKGTDVAVAIRSIVKPELDQRIATLHASRKG